MKKQRYLELDFIRGLAIVLMMIFHLSYDLNFMGYININIYHGDFWHYFRDVIIFLFMISVGISLYIVNKNGYNHKKNLFRLGKLALVALLITGVSIYMYPHSWIYFGIIHLIFIASIISLYFASKPILSLFVAIAILLFNLFGYLDMSWCFELLKEPLHLPKYTKDIAHLFPWLGVVILGIFVGYKKWFLFGLKANVIVNFISFMGRHALVIYLIHQPIFMGILELIKRLL